MTINQIFNPLKLSFKVLILVLLTGNFSLFAAGGGDEGGEFNIQEMIFNHIGDSNEFHIGGSGDGSVSFPLPCILYHPERGWDFMLSSAFEHGHKEINGYKMDHGVIKSVDPNDKFYDLSITKNVASMMLAAVLLCLLFIPIARRYKNNIGKAPKGSQSLLEPIFVFIQDEVIKSNIPDKWMKFLPFLMTMFFFILILNLMGLIPFFPGSANVSGNIAFTMCLALFTFVITTINGNKHYWQHVFWMPGVPVLIKPVLAIVEFAGLFIKPFSLMIRLFANITGGHILILSLVGLIFIFGKVGANVAGAAGGAAVAVPFVLFMNLIELLVAFLQAFIFTILSALYIGMAVEETHH